MIMYIPEFWCGVIATILAEIVGTIAVTIFLTKENKDTKEE
jgi:hypothetical protein|nr:MAG TPA: hypothetical protein [Caudoviricetes sp.]